MAIVLIFYCILRHLPVTVPLLSVLARVYFFMKLLAEHFVVKNIFFPLTGGCSEGLGAFRFFFKHDKRRKRPQEECFVRSVVLDAHDLG